MPCYELCEEVIGQGKTPVLYADADYIPSNRAYQKIGFVFWQNKRGIHR